VKFFNRNLTDSLIYFYTTIFCFYFIFDDSEGWSQGLELATQVLYYLSYSSSPYKSIFKSMFRFVTKLGIRYRDFPSLDIKEMQFKTKLRFHLTSIRIAIIKNTTTNMCWWGCGEKGTLVHCWRECKLVQHFGEKNWRLLKNLYIDL
jgi:hypothetical protein